MRCTILTLAIALSHGLFGQSEDRFRNFHGLRSNDAEFFEGEGYEIFIHQVENTLDERGIVRIQKRYSMKDAQLTIDSVLHLKVLGKTVQQHGVLTHLNYYLVPDKKKSKVIGFTRPKTRDVNLEREFIISYLTNSIPLFVYTPLEIDSIDFIDRTVYLRSICKWMSPHNIQCPNYGQVSWAIFDDLKVAEDYRDTQLEITRHKSMVDIMEEKWLAVKFEGQETRALRRKVRIEVPRFAMGGSNILVIYYVTGEVRGKFLTCIFSQYTDDINGHELAPLLAEFLTLQNADGTWPDGGPFSGDSYHSQSDSISDQSANGNEGRPLILIDAGVWVPIGNLSRKVGASPNIGLYWPFVDKPDRNFRVDLIVSLFFPQNTKQFSYSSEDTTFTTKIGNLAGLLGLQLTRTKPIKNKSFIDYFDQTYGLGVGIFPTTTEKPKCHPDDETQHYSFDTVHLSYGVVFRKKIFRDKSVGLAIRYNFTPTSWFGNEAGKGFGNSSFTTSLLFRL